MLYRVTSFTFALGAANNVPWLSYEEVERICMLLCTSEPHMHMTDLCKAAAREKHDRPHLVCSHSSAGSALQNLHCFDAIMCIRPWQAPRTRNMPFMRVKNVE